MAADVHKILIVDDEKGMHNLIKDILEVTGRYHYLHAYNGKDGVRLFEEHEPSLTLLDITMPIMNGVQVLEKLDPKAKKKCPIIVMSGFASSDEQNIYLEMGARMFMGKPFQVMTLIENINRILSPGMPDPPLESRCHKRYKVKDKLIAFSLKNLCKLTDISVGGAALKYTGRSGLPSKWNLDIMMEEDNFYATIPVKLAWEKDIQPSPLFRGFTKHVGVQFDDLTTENKAKVDYLIKMHEELAVQSPLSA